MDYGSSGGLPEYTCPSDQPFCEGFEAEGKWGTCTSARPPPATTAPTTAPTFAATKAPSVAPTAAAVSAEANTASNAAATNAAANTVSRGDEERDELTTASKSRHTSRKDSTGMDMSLIWTITFFVIAAAVARMWVSACTPTHARFKTGAMVASTDDVNGLGVDDEGPAAERQAAHDAVAADRVLGAGSDELVDCEMQEMQDRRALKLDL
eukprot:2590329-Prymnesium_polylepis.2